MLNEAWLRASMRAQGALPVTHFPSRSSWLAALTLMAFGSLGSLGAGCKKKEPATSDTTVQSAEPVKSAPSATYSAGDKVDVEWKGSYWKGKVLSVEGTKYKIHYLGWSTSFDETVGTERLRAPTDDAKTGSTPEPSEAPVAEAQPSAAAPTSAPKSTPAAGYNVGSKVDVSWKGTFYQAKILSKVGTSYRVHYLGWGANWDENVPPTRLRAWTGSAKRGTGPE